MFASAPAVPDYTGAAEQQSAASQWLAQFQTAANRPNIRTPWGSMSWTRTGAPSLGAGGMARPLPAGAPSAHEQPGEAPTDAAGGEFMGGAGYGPRLMRTGRDPLFPRTPREGPQPTDDRGAARPAPERGGVDYSQDPYAAGGGWEMSVELSPAEQAALEAQQRIGASRSGIAESLLGDVAREQGPLDLSGLPGLDTGEAAREKAYEATYGRMSSRLDPQWDRREQQLRAQLMSQGLKPGDESYDTQMSQFNRDRTDAYQTAQESATQLGEQAAAGSFQRGLGGRQQALGELLQKRGWSLNEVNALLGGQQIQMPQFPGFAQAGAGQAPNYLGAAQAGYQGQLDAYSIQQALLASLMGGGASMGAAYLGRP